MRTALRYIFNPWGLLKEQRTALAVATEALDKALTYKGEQAGTIRYLRQRLNETYQHAAVLERALKSPILADVGKEMAAHISRAGMAEVHKAVMQSAANDNVDGSYFTVHFDRGLLMMADEKSLMQEVMRQWRQHGMRNGEVSAFSTELPEKQAVTTIEVRVPSLAFRQILSA